MDECRRRHRLGERCGGCGYISAPARFYWDGDKELSQEGAAADYLEWLSSNNQVTTQLGINNQVGEQLTPGGARRGAGRPKHNA